MTSVNELAREGDEATRWNRLHPTEAPRVPYLTQQLSHSAGPFVAATDYQRAHTNQLREFIPGSFTVLGTDLVLIGCGLLFSKSPVVINGRKVRPLVLSMISMQHRLVWLRGSWMCLVAPI